MANRAMPYCKRLRIRPRTGLKPDFPPTPCSRVVIYSSNTFGVSSASTFCQPRHLGRRAAGLERRQHNGDNHLVFRGTMAAILPARRLICSAVWTASPFSSLAPQTSHRHDGCGLTRQHDLLLSRAFSSMWRAWAALTARRGLNANRSLFCGARHAQRCSLVLVRKHLHAAMA